MFTALTLAVAVAMGVGAADSNSLIVRIDGKETKVTLAGIPAGSESGQMFAQCLVAGRVVRVSGPHSAAKVTMLDNSSVAGHVAEFLQTQTASDPCALGKAAYQPVALHAVAASAASASASKALPAVTKKPAREVHVSFGSGASSKNALQVQTTPAAPIGATSRPAAPAAQPSYQPTYAAPPTVGTYTPPTVGTYNPSTAGANQSLAPGSTQPSLQQQGTQQIPQQGPQPVPTTTYKPPV